MKEAPFRIGEMVQYIDVTTGIFEFEGIVPKIKRGDIVKVVDVIKARAWRISKKKDWYVETDRHPGFMYIYSDFRSIEENTYENISKELAVLPQDEISDVKIKELVN